MEALEGLLGARLDVAEALAADEHDHLVSLFDDSLDTITSPSTEPPSKSAGQGSSEGGKGAAESASAEVELRRDGSGVGCKEHAPWGPFGRPIPAERLPRCFGPEPIPVVAAPILPESGGWGTGPEAGRGGGKNWLALRRRTVLEETRRIALAAEVKALSGEG